MSLASSADSCNFMITLRVLKGRQRFGVKFTALLLFHLADHELLEFLPYASVVDLVMLPLDVEEHFLNTLIITVFLPSVIVL